jgi:hypothetical protein
VKYSRHEARWASHARLKYDMKAKLVLDKYKLEFEDIPFKKAKKGKK